MVGPAGEALGCSTLAPVSFMRRLKAAASPLVNGVVELELARPERPRRQ